MSRQREIYTLPEKDVPLTEEELAVVLAKTSRSPLSFRQIAAELRADDASKFHEKYVLGYGHGSVAEFAMGAVCFENVSIVASKVLESMARPAVAEKSTRYQRFDADAVYVPADVDADRAAELLKFLFAEYDFFTDELMKFTERVVPQDAKNRAGAVKGRAFDSARYLLPAGTQTNLAIRINALDIPRMIGTLLASPHLELREIGDSLKTTALGALPTLIKYAHEDTYDKAVSQVVENQLGAKANLANGYYSTIFQNRTEKIGNTTIGTQSVVLDKFSPDAVLFIASSLLCRQPSTIDLETVNNIICSMSPSQIESFLNNVLSPRSQFDPVPKEFSSAHLRYQITMDYGAFRDLQRHRRCLQIPQALTTSLGFAVPDDIQEIGLGERYLQTMERVKILVDSLSAGPSSEYMIPLAFLHRTIYEMDIREHFYIVELRSKPAGHFSYRRIVNMMQACFALAHPFLAKYVRCVPMEGIGVHS